MSSGPKTPAAWHHAEEFLAGLRPVMMFCGGYGSGKTEVAVNFALRLAEAGNAVSIADLDIVNLYFRSREVRGYLRERSVRVILPDDQLMNADLPMVQPEVGGVVESAQGFALLDVGGDPAGARVMQAVAHRVPREHFAGFLVLNSRRPFTRDVAGVRKLMAEVAAAAGLPVTDIIVNSHLIEETTAQVIEEGIRLAEAVAAETGVRVALVTVERQFLGDFDVAACRYPVLVLDRRMLKPWEPRSNWLGRYRVDS